MYTNTLTACRFAALCLILPLSARSEITLLTRSAFQAAGPAAGSQPSQLPVLSGDGSKLFFSSRASDLTTNHMPLFSTVVFMRDLVSGQTRRLTPDNTAQPYVTVPLSASDDGQTVLLSSTDPTFGPNDNNDSPDLFVQDTASGVITPVSIRFGTNAMGDAGSDFGFLSADGKQVVFTSDASDLTPPALRHWRNAYHRDLTTHETTLLNANTNRFGNLVLAMASDDISITPDARRVAFTCTGTNLLNRQAFPFSNTPQA